MMLIDVEHHREIPSPSSKSPQGTPKRDLTMAICGLCREKLSIILEDEHVFELMCGHYCHLECLYLFNRLNNPPPDPLETDVTPPKNNLFRCMSCSEDVACVDSLAVEKANTHHTKNGYNIPSSLNSSPILEHMDFDIILDSRPSSSRISVLLSEELLPKLQFDVCQEQLNMKLITPGIDEELYTRKLDEIVDYVSQFSDSIDKVVIYDETNLILNGMHQGTCLCVLLDRKFLAINERSNVVVEISISDLSPNITTSPYGFTILPTDHNYPEIQMLTNPIVACNWEAHLERLVIELSCVGTSYSSLSESSIVDTVTTVHGNLHTNIILCLSVANCSKFSNEEYGEKTQDCIKTTLASLGPNDKLGLVLVGQNFNQRVNPTLGTYTGLANANWDGWDVILQDLRVYQNTMFETQYDELLLKVEKCQQLMNVNQIHNAFGNSVNKVLFVGLSDLKEGLREHDLVAECMMSLKEICSVHFINLSPENGLEKLQSWLEGQDANFIPSPGTGGSSNLRVDYNWIFFHNVTEFKEFNTTFVSSLFRKIAFPAVSVHLTYDVENLDQPGIFENRKQTLCIHDLPSGYSEVINWGSGFKPAKLMYSMSWLKQRVSHSITL